MKSKLIEYIKTSCLCKGDYTLSSGQKTNFYVDLKFGALYGPCLFEIVQCLRKATKNIDFNAIGGPCIGADPIVGAYLNMYCDKGFLIRKESKKYGKKERLIGSIEPGDNCIVVDDVTTSGKSLLEAIKIVENFGCKIAKAISIVDRLQGCQEIMEKNKIPFEPILTIEDIENSLSTFKGRCCDEIQDQSVE